MIQPYLILAARIREEFSDLERLIERAERGIAASQQHPEDQDLFLDLAALSLHDIYLGLERIFRQIAATVDNEVPSTFPQLRSEFFSFIEFLEKNWGGLRLPLCKI